MSINPSIRIEQVQRLRALADAMKDIPDNASTMDDLESWLKHHAMAEAAQNNIDTQGAYLKAVKDRLIASLAENRRKLDKALDARLRKILGGHTGSALEQEMKKFAALSGAIPAGLSVSNPVAEVIERNLLQKESEFHKADILDVAVKSTASENSLGELRRRLANELALLQQQRTRKLLFIAGGVILASLIFFIMAFVVYAKKQCAPATYLQHSFCASLPDTIAVRPTGTPTVAPTSKPTLPPTQTPTSTSTNTPTATPTATVTPTPTASPTPKPVVGPLGCNLKFGEHAFTATLPTVVVRNERKEILWTALKIARIDAEDCDPFNEKHTKSISDHNYRLIPKDGEWPDFLQQSEPGWLLLKEGEKNLWTLNIPLLIAPTNSPGEKIFYLQYYGGQGNPVNELDDATDSQNWTIVEGYEFILKWNAIRIATPTPTVTPTPTMTPSPFPSPTLSPTPRQSGKTPKPTTPVPSPTPETPSPTPETPSPTPETPSPTPETPSPTPETPSPTPETPSPTPETPSPTPETPSPTPETPSPTPETPSPTPKPPATDTPKPKPSATPKPSTLSSDLGIWLPVLLHL